MTSKETSLEAKFRRKKKKRYLDTVNKPPKQTLQSLEIFLLQNSKDTVLCLFSNERQPFHLRQAVAHVPCHLQQLLAGHLPSSNCCFT